MERLEALFREAGIPLWGVCDYRQTLPLLPCRKAKLIPPGASRVVMAAFPYYAGEAQHSNLARYAWGEDYHGICLGLLEQVCKGMRLSHPDCFFLPFADDSPIREVRCAVAAGLGLLGDHGMVITPAYGAYVFLGAIVTDCPLPLSIPGGECPHCGRCRRACPGGALAEEGLRRECCLSFLTQKKRLTPEEEARVAAGGMAWGCDRCLEACPLNPKRLTPLAPFRASLHPLLTEEDLAAGLESRAYAYKGTALLARNLKILKEMPQ